MPKCTLRPNGEQVEVESGLNLLEALRAKDIYVKSSCGGHATCSDCVIKIVSGEDNLSPPPFEELKLLGNVFHITKERLACQTCISGDVTIDLSNHDKDRDERNMRNKAGKFAKKKPIVRKKDEAAQIKEARSKEQEKESAAKDVENAKWEKHWDKATEPNKPKRLGGNKRPKTKKY